jgi:ribA/ribD-fused uncharacterized protein
VTRPDVIPTFTGDYFWLSNFYRSTLEIEIFGERVLFDSSEGAYQAGKLLCSDMPEVDKRNTLLRLATQEPGITKKIARKIPIDTAKWDGMKDEWMRKVVFAKFLQNSDLCAKLIQTGTCMLVEGNTWNDCYWGRCNGKGLNRLGVILMETRGYFVFKDWSDPRFDIPN